MAFLTVGNLNHYIKNLKLQSQWTLKRQTGNYNAKGDSLKELLDGSSRRTQETGSSGDHGDDTLRKIHQKLEAGRELTPKERDYLQTHDPQSYRELVNLEQEQYAYEQSLRRCKSREEAEQLQITRLNASLTRLRSVENNPHIPLAKKLEIAMTEKQRVDRVTESTNKFVASGEYAKLPTYADERKAQEEALEDSLPMPEKPQLEGPEDTVSKAPWQPQPSQPEDGSAHFDAASPEEKKVRRAKARAAYATAQVPEQPFGGSLEIQA